MSRSAIHWDGASTRTISYLAPQLGQLNGTDSGSDITPPNRKSLIERKAAPRTSRPELPEPNILTGSIAAKMPLEDERGERMPAGRTERPTTLGDVMRIGSRFTPVRPALRVRVGANQCGTRGVKASRRSSCGRRLRCVRLPSNTCS